MAEAEASFDSDAIRHTSALGETLKGSGVQLLHTLPMTTMYPPLPQEVLGKNTVFESTTEHLLTALHIARLTKTEMEIELIREANRISSGAHETLMRELGWYAARRARGAMDKEARTGKESLGDWEVESEADAEAVFVAACRRVGRWVSSAGLS